MSVKSFKFVSPGVFINEIDNSFIPKSADAIGPVVIGRASRGLAMQPIKVQSYSEFVELYGDTVPGNSGGDVYRDGNYQSPMYGTYAAKAFLNSNVAPLTYVRLLGTQDSNATTAGEAGWKTTQTPARDIFANGGAYGMWVFESGSSIHLGTGSLAAVWYIDSGSAIYLSGNMRGTTGSTGTANGVGVVVGSTSDGLYTAFITSSDGSSEKVTFNFDDDSEYFIRKRFNTNPQLGNTGANTFYPAASEKVYWLGETFEQSLREGVSGSLTGGGTDVTSAETQAVMLPIASGSSAAGPQDMTGINYNEAVAGWFIGQDLGTATSYSPESATKLFRLLGRGHGEWLSKNCKVSISKIRASTTSNTDYGTFSVLIRSLRDTDNNVVILERFDNLTLDPTSPDYIARRIGDVYHEWDGTARRLKQYGEYPNQSKYVYVEMNDEIDRGATDSLLLPFGYYGPPKFTDILSWSGVTGSSVDGYNAIKNRYVYIDGLVAGASADLASATDSFFTLLSGAIMSDYHEATMTGSLLFPKVRLRHSSSDGGLADQTNAYFGMRTTRTQTSTRASSDVADPHRLWLTSLNSDPVGSTIAGVDSWCYIFSMDDIVKDTEAGGYYYSSGSRAGETSYTATSTNTYKTLIDEDINRFTAPFWGGHDAVDITKPDPFYNDGIGTADISSYTYHTIKRAIDTVADPEMVDMNVLTMPGLTKDALTTHIINVCEERADSLGIIDLANVYIPPHESYQSSKSSRIGTTPTAAATALRNRRLDSSYGCTFYPWVQTRDEPSGQLVWIPPSVAMLGVFGSSQAASDVWFAPAGFNRGGLSDGAAGVSVVNVTERLTSKERDILYENRINPIATFPSTGIVVFGQKTLQERQSALDRINVRRLAIYLKKQISILSTNVLFEQNVQATWTRFKGLIEPFLANVKVQFGITDYRLILDDTTTTPDLVDQNIMYAKIMVKPARAIEFIAIDFVITSTGASFDD